MVHTDQLITIDRSRLSNVLVALNTKADLMEFAMRYDLPFKQSLKKQDLAEYIEKNLLEHVEVLMQVLPKDELLALQKIVHAGGSLETDEELDVFELEYRTLVIRPDQAAIPIGKFRYDIPSNLQHVLSNRIDRLVNDPYVDKWDKMDHTCIGLLQLYGVLSESDFHKLWKKATGETLEWRDFFKLFRSRTLVRDWCQAFYSARSLCLALNSVEEPVEMYEAVKKRKDLDYKVFPLDNVLMAAEFYLYVVDIDLVESLITLFVDMNGGKVNQAEIQLAKLWKLHQNGAHPTQLIAALANDNTFKDKDQIQTLLMALTNFTNAAPNWLLKGNSPNEVHANRQISSKEPIRNVIPFTPRVAVGRNDLCPCGSGKKYKKCCGAN